MIQNDAARGGNDRTARLGHEGVGRLLVSFSIPAIVGMMVQALYNIVDRIFIGNGVGSLGLAGITVSFPIMLIGMAFGMLIGVGGGAVLSISLGEGKKDYAQRVLNVSVFLSIAISVALVIGGYAFLDPLLSFLGASEAVLPYARTYMRIILLGVIPNSLGFGLNGFIRAEGSPRTAMVTMLIGAILNTVLDPLFIFVFDMGIAGAAWATIISQTLSAVWVLAYYLGPRSHLKLRLGEMRPRADIVIRIAAIGSAPFAMQLASSALNAILNMQLKTYGGDLAISAMGVIYSFVMLILMPIFGLNQGAQPIIGYNYGARNRERVVKATELAILVASVITTLGWLATRIFPAAIMAAFSAKDAELIALGSRAMRIFFALFPIVGFQIVASSFFQAIGKPRQAMVLSLSRQVLFLIPLLVILPRFAGLQGVFMASPIADVLSAAVTGTFFWLELRRMRRDAAAATLS